MEEPQTCELDKTNANPTKITTKDIHLFSLSYLIECINVVFSFKAKRL